MTIGATRAGSVPEQLDAGGSEAVPVRAAPGQLPAVIGRPASEWLVPSALVLAVVGWLLLVGWGFEAALAGRRLNVAVIASWSSVALAPLALPAVLWLGWQRRPLRMRRMQEASAAELRREAIVLDHLVERLVARSADAQGQLVAQADLLRGVGDETARRILSVGETLREGSALLARHAAHLDDAAETARTDLGVLIADLPEAEARVQSLVLRVQALGGEVGGQAAMLGTRVSSLDQQQQDLRAGAQDLVRAVETAHTRAQALKGELLEAGSALEANVGGAAAAAVDGMEAVRAGASAQTAALSALLDQTRAALHEAGVEALGALRRRSAACVAEVEAIGRALEAGSEAAGVLAADITRDLAELETRQVTIGEAGMQRARLLRDATAEVTGELERLTGAIAASDLASGAALGRAEGLRQSLDRTAEILVEGLPPLLLEGEARTGALTAEVERSAVAVDGLVRKVEEQEATAATLGQMISQAFDAADARALSAEDRLTRLAQTAASLAGSIEAADAEAGRFAERAGPQLLDALVRVREAAAQAADRARDALSEALRPLGPTLREEAHAAIEAAITDALAARGEALARAVDVALESARVAAEALDERLAALDLALQRVDTRVSEGVQAAEQAGDNSFSRRMALLIESLNSTAIDVAKVLSNDVTDTAWSAYLKGDRGVFARRAVRLLDAGEAREIVRHYEADGEFRAQVDRYIHDFEAMLRDVLAFRAGTPVGVTLLSSDVGKLYVALAQAIERLRA